MLKRRFSLSDLQIQPDPATSLGSCSDEQHLRLPADVAVEAFVDADNRPTGALLEGRCTFSQVALDMQIHVNDSLETASAHGSFVVPPKLTITVLLEGDLDVALDGQPLIMSARQGPSGHLWINRRPARLERWVRAGERIRKVTVSLPLPMSAAGHGIPCGVARMVAGLPAGQTVLRWTPTARTIRYAEEILSASAEPISCSPLESTIAALGIIRSAFSQYDFIGARDVLPSPSTRDVTRAREARELILRSIDEPLPLADIASRIGMSVSTLQRVFKAAFGTTVNEFIRTRRLELARLALVEQGATVGEAAFRAGYSSAANFSTAFQRAFGYSPSSCLRS